MHGVRVQEEGHGVHEDGVGMQGDEDEDGVHGEGGGLHEDGEMGKWCKGNGVGYMGMEGVGKGVRCIKEGAVHGGQKQAFLHILVVSDRYIESALLMC